MTKAELKEKSTATYLCQDCKRKFDLSFVFPDVAKFSVACLFCHGVAKKQW